MGFQENNHLSYNDLKSPLEDYEASCCTNTRKILVLK